MSDTIIWLGVWTILLWGIGTLRLNLMVRRLTKILFFPGLAIEALIRCVACLITGTPIEKFRPLDDGTPFLKTGRCPVQRIGIPIAMAVRMSLTLLVAVILVHFGIPSFQDSAFDLPTFLHHREGIAGSVPEFFASIPGSSHYLELGSVWSWVTLYTLGTLALATGLSTKELFAAVWGWGGLLAVASAFTWLGVKFSFLSRGWFIERLFLPSVWTSFSLFVTLCFFAFLFVAILHALPGLAQKMKPQRTSQEQGMPTGAG